MKRSLRKITSRSIRRNLGRFLAIMFIVTLGSGFLTGLRVTKTAMLHTLDNYEEQNSFFDFKIVSTLGLTDEDESYFASIRGVESAEGACSTDALFTMPDGTEKVLKVHSMPWKIDVPLLRSGRMPESGDECVLDAWYFKNMELGGRITLAAAGNTEDAMDMFSFRSYKVVGLVNSPLYINFARGNTTLGNGSVAGFVYIPTEGFSAEAYTEIFVRMGNLGSVYSDEYEEAAEALADNLEDAADMRATLRYDQIVGEAEDKYNDALNRYQYGVDKLEEQKAEAQAELSDALRDIEDGERKLRDSRRTLDENWKKLADGEAELSDGWAEYNANKPEAEAKLADAKAGIDDGLAAYNDGLAQYEAGLAEYEKAAAAYGEDMLKEQKAQLDGVKAQLDESKARLDSAQAEYDAGVKELADAEDKLTSSEAELEDSRAKLTKGEADYRQGLADLAKGRADYEEGKAELETEVTDAQEKLDDAKAELEDARAKIDDIEKPSVFALDRYTNSGYSSFENDSTIVEAVSRVFPLFFFLVTALVCVTTMNRMVDDERTQIGTLKSLGYKNGEIMRGYLEYTALASGIGSVLGVAAGSVVFPKIIWQGYNIMYGFTDIDLVFDWRLSVIVCAAFVACSLIVTWLSCRKELREEPAELIRPRTPKAGKRIFLERIPFLWKGLSFLGKVSARNIFRYKKRMFMMIVGIAGCTALLLTGFGINDSITGLADAQFGEISLYDMQVSFKDPMTAETEKDFVDSCGDNIDGCAFLSMYTVDAVLDSGLKSVYLVGTDERDMTPFMDFHMDGDTVAFPGDGEVLINDNLAKLMGVGVGDTITLQNSELRTLSLTVGGIYYNVIYNYAYVTLDTLRAAPGFDSDVNAAYICLPEDMDIHEAAAAVADSSYVLGSSVNVDTKDMVNNSLDGMKYIVALIIFCAGALAFIVLYNLTNINITERIREIATIKVLGFRQWESASYVYRENMVLTLMGAAAGIPLGIWLHSYVMDSIKVDMMSFTRIISWQAYVWSIALTIVFAMIVDVFMYSRLNGINMAESLKSVE